MNQLIDWKRFSIYCCLTNYTTTTPHLTYPCVKYLLCCTNNLSLCLFFSSGAQGELNPNQDYLQLYHLSLLLVKDFEEALGLILLGHVYSQMQVSVFQKAAARHYLFGVCVLVDMHIYRLFLLHLVTCVSARWFCVYV